MSDFILAVNPNNLHVGCVLVQAMFGCPYPSVVSACFDTNLWELSPSECKRYKMDLEELPHYVELLGGNKQMAINVVEQLKQNE